MKDVLVGISGLLSLTSGVPYVRDVARGRTHPNLVTWFTWLLVACINAAAALSEGAVGTAMLSGTIALTDVAILLMGIRKGVKRYTWFDALCQALALLGVGLWLGSGDAGLAVGLSLAVVVIGALPTWRHAWIAPFAETWQGFAIAVVASLLTVASLPQFTFVALAFPVVAAINCAVMVGIILLRRRAFGRVRSKSCTV